MQDRTYLHKLIDSLPERVLEQVQCVLEYQQNPQDMHADLNTLQGRMHEIIQRTFEKGCGYIVGAGGAGSVWPEGSGECSVQGFEASGAHLTLTFRYFRGYKLEISERLALGSEAGLLRYEQQIVGPLGKTSEHNINFPLF
jgi:hypothetical protein